MLNRQKTLVMMLRSVGGSATHLQLVKWAFLLAHETSSRGGSSFYQFLPYRYGPYSFSLVQEVDSLKREGLIRDVSRNQWSLTPIGQKTTFNVAKPVEADIDYILDRYGHLSIASLTDSIYSRYSWFTVNSDMKDKRREKRRSAEAAVYTAGYEGLLVDGFLNMLMEQGIQQLVDVRNNPVSRRYGFHKSTLSRLCGYLHIDYCHLPQLGIASQHRQELETLTDYQALFEYYERDVISRRSTEIEQLAAILHQKPSVLVCMEANPEFCHRSRLANAVAPVANLPVRHLGWPR